MSNPFDIAAKQIGLNEADKKVALTEYLANGGQRLDPAVTAWCAAFVNATLQQSGQKGTNKLNARSYMDWGQAVDAPERGDIAVFSRGDPNGWEGHVGFFDGYNEDGTIRVLGGNQGNAVSIQSYSPDRLLGFRRGETQNALAPQAGQPQMGQLQQPQRPEFKANYLRTEDFMNRPQNNMLAQPASFDPRQYM